MSNLSQLILLVRQLWQEHWPMDSAWLQREGLWERETELAAQLLALRTETLLLRGTPQPIARERALKELVLNGPLTTRDAKAAAA